MIPLPAPNTITRPYRGLSVQETDLDLTPEAVEAWLLGREVYRRTDYLALRNGDRVALVAVRRESDEPLFSPVVEARVLAAGPEVVFVHSPETDVGNATALARAAQAHARPGAKAYLVQGRHEHVNFIWRPQPVRITVTEVVPPEPPKLVAMAEQAIAFDEQLPPIELVADVLDLRTLAAEHPADTYLLPCRGAGTHIAGRLEFLDTRPAERLDWTLVGCERSAQFHRHFYGNDAPRVDICPRSTHDLAATAQPTLAKCCLLERGVQQVGSSVVVPWGSNLDEVRGALRMLVGLHPAEQPITAG